MLRKYRTVLIGLDGVPSHLLKNLSDKSIMPNLKDIRNNGIFKTMESSIPEISSVSWSSMITGSNPGEHNIYGFTDIIPNTYTMSFPNKRNLKTKPFWEKEDHKKHVIINVPSTYPAQKLNGFLVSGFVSLDLEKATYPLSYVEKLKKIDYRIDVDSNKVHKSTRLFLGDLFNTHEKRIKLYRYMWDKIDWDNFMLVFTGSDRLEHFLWDAYEDENHKYHQEFLKYFQKIDEVIGEINSRLAENDSLIMLSDHGMEGIKTNVNINTLLEENGLLKLGKNYTKRYNNIMDGTKAFAMEPSRIYLNKKGRYPKGYVGKNQEEDIINEITDVFKNLKYKGEKVIRRIARKEEIYHGPYFDNAPDVVLLPNHGFCFRGGVSNKPLFEHEDIIKGMHTQQDAFLYVKNKGNKHLVPENPNIEDVTTIMRELEQKTG